jgi:hypothetical protein
MSRDTIKEWLSIPAGLFLLAFASSYVIPFITSGQASLTQAVLLFFLNPFSIIPGMIGLGLLVHAPVSRARRERMKRITRGEEDVAEPLAAHERDHGFLSSHLWSVLGSVFVGLTMLLVGGLAALTPDATTSITALGVVFAFVGLGALAFPLKWWREWSARQELMNAREEWQLPEPPRGHEEAGVALDFGEDAQSEHVDHAHAQEVTQAR